MPDYSSMANAELRAINDDLQGLTDEQWSTMTVCAPWTVRHLAAHMTALGNQSPVNFFKGLITNGFSFDKFVAKDLVKYNQGSNADVLAGFAKTVQNPKTPPGPKYVALGEYMTHAEDIRRALGISRDYPAAAVSMLGDAYVKTGAPIGGKKRASGLTLKASDMDWSVGSGPEVTGPGLALVRGLSGRADRLDQCSGPGLDTFRSRM